MLRVIVNGAMGHMGSILVNLVDAGEDYELAAAVDPASKGGAVLPSLEGFEGDADVIIDFSHHTAVMGLLDWAKKHRVAAVIATTGHDEKEKAAINEAAKEIPVFFSANMSMGIALLAQMAKKAASVFPDADVEIVEIHHNRKLDAPSGTALMLAEAVREGREGEGPFVTGRSGMAKRQPGDIGLHAVRLGNFPGVHEVMISTGTQTLTLKHEVHDRALLAEGALDAARFVAGKKPGLYDMKGLISAE